MANREQPDGKLRQSQVLTTYGPGAMLDLVNSAVMVSGLEHWRGHDLQRFDEERLAAHLRSRGTPRLMHDKPFHYPPAGEEREPDYRIGIDVVESPRWFVCPRAACRRLVLIGSDHAEDSHGRYKCDCHDKARYVPVRFVMACPKGHVEEFPWKAFVHEGPSECSGADLRLEEGVSGDFADVRVRCRICSRSRQMSEAKGKGYEVGCRGKRPWIGDDDPKPCEHKLRLLVRSASNSYFSVTVSALSIPEQFSAFDLAEKYFDRLKTLSAANVASWRASLEFAEEQLRQHAERFSDAEILTAVDALRNGRKRTLPPLREAEYRTLKAASPEQPGRRPNPDDEREALFFAGSLEKRSTPKSLAQVVLLHRLREVRVLTGFTRFEALVSGPENESASEHDLEVKVAPLAADPTWLPGVEVFGEGIFFELDLGRLREWEQRPAVIERVEQLRRGYQAWTKGRVQPPPFFGGRFYLLHTLSHLLIQALSLECGYSASAIRERIYCSGADTTEDMAGILLSTGSPGSEGTLGGLVEQGRRLTEHLHRAADLGGLCANDPVCSAHDPERDPTERYLEGAACHGCVFVAEPSCEQFNKLLDRALVYPTLGHSGVAYFAADGVS